MRQQRCSVGADSGARSAPTVGLGQHRQRGLWQRQQRGSWQRQQLGSRTEIADVSPFSYKITDYKKPNKMFNRNLTMGQQRCSGWRRQWGSVGTDSGARSAPTVGNSKCSIHNLNPSHLFGNHEKTTKILQKKCRRIFKKPDVYYNVMSFSSKGWGAAPAEASTRLLRS